MHKEDKSTIDAVRKVSPAVVSIVIAKMVPKIKEVHLEDGAGPFGFMAPQFFDGNIKRPFFWKISGLSSLVSCLHRMRTSFSPVALNFCTDFLICGAVSGNGD